MIKEVAFVDVAGSGKAVGLTDAQFSRAEREYWGDDAYDGDPHSVGGKPWAAAGARIKKFCKGVKTGCGRYDVPELY